MDNSPSERSSFEMAFPIPVAPPVTSATFPAKSPLRKMDIVGRLWKKKIIMNEREWQEMICHFLIQFFDLFIWQNVYKTMATM